MKEKEKMLFLGFFQRIIFMILLFMPIFFNGVESLNRILLDTDVDTDDFLALLYILKLNRSEIDLKVFLFSPCLFSFFLFLSLIVRSWLRSHFLFNRVFNMLYGCMIVFFGPKYVCEFLSCKRFETLNPRILWLY